MGLVRIQLVQFDNRKGITISNARPLDITIPAEHSSNAVDMEELASELLIHALD